MTRLNVEAAMRFKLPPQIVRLVLLTMGIVGSYLAARYFLTPPSFGEFGWYRGDALEERASLPRHYAGKEACSECHEDKAKQLAKFEHKSLSCEVCHGPGQQHVDAPDVDKFKPDKKNTTSCLRCHEENPTRPKWLKQINVRDHYSGQKCVECHVPHAPSEVP
jgi:hypothetical protein